jgi:hypothetical protein
MIDHAKLAPALNRVRSSRTLARAALLAFAAGGIWIGAGTAPASAQTQQPDMKWETGCAWRDVTPGSGDALRQYNCTRQKECQLMANAKGGMMMGMGCFFVQPAPTSPSPATTQTRPSQQQ